uniref:SHSP domain-containing protein n=1 Tax=Peronospora matthiolae TaxID=2874970 RepID=A0AAV1UUB5_9STRA
MPLLSYEGVDVELPSNLTGIEVEVTAGTLTIHCCNFTGDVVLRQRTTVSSRASQQTRPCASYSSKRSHDTSRQRDDGGFEANVKRLRPRFLNEAEQTVLLARLNGSPSSCSRQVMDKSVAVEGTTGGGVQTTKKTLNEEHEEEGEQNCTDVCRGFFNVA